MGLNGLHARKHRFRDSAPVGRPQFRQLAVKGPASDLDQGRAISEWRHLVALVRSGRLRQGWVRMAGEALGHAWGDYGLEVECSRNRPDCSAGEVERAGWQAQDSGSPRGIYMAIIPVPIPFPLYRDYYPSYYPSHSYRDSYQDERHHQEMMGKLDKLAEKDIGVSVVGADILQVARAAYESLSREVSDYEDRVNALARRLIRIEARSDRERERKAKAKADAAREEYIQQNLSGRRWWERLSWLPSLYICRESLIADWEALPSYLRDGSSFYWSYEMRRELSSREWLFRQHCPKPRFYDSFEDVKKVYESASLLPGATITIPVATIQVIGQIAAGLNAGAIEAD